MILCNRFQRLLSITDKMADFSGQDELDDVYAKDSISIASTDSFVSAAEVREAFATMVQKYVIGVTCAAENI